MILASQSPRRSDLLKLIATDFRMIPSDVDESYRDHESPAEYVARLAEAKARAVAAKAFPAEVIIGSDTAVESAGIILNKPQDEADFLAMMERLSGATHQVYSGVCVLRETWCAVKVVKTNVTFRQLSMPERLHYWQTGEPLDKAGGYGIQGLAVRFIESIHGSYTNVVGLPLVELEAMLNDAS